MSQPVEIQLNLDPAGYVSGAGQAAQASDALTRSMTAAAASATPLQRALAAATPSRALLAGLTAAVGLAGRTESSLSTLSAQSTVTGTNVGRLAGNMRTLARDIPIGNAGARELVTTITRMGVAAKGNEDRIASLAKTAGQLGGATGEGPQELASGMIALSRSMDTGLDPKRFKAISDSITTLQAESGGSATGMLGFAKAIAPMADAAGIGETKVLGISSAFAKLGEDGFAGANAFNKMLSDLNKSVRDGSPELDAYAQIVGSTREEFKALFEADPTEALTRVTEAIASAGPQGPRLLEQIGIEGVRGQRSLQQLSASGGLREAVATSVGAYGSGATDKAAKAAFGGLSDSLTDLRTTVEQTTEAFGRPLLGAVTGFTDLLNLALTPLRAVAESKVGQVGIGAAGLAALPMLAGAALFKPLLTIAGIGQASSSGIVRSALAGAALGRAGGSYGAASESRLASMRVVGGADQLRRAQAGEDLGRGRWGRANRRVFDFATGAFMREPTGGPALPPGFQRQAQRTDRLGMYQSMGLGPLATARAVGLGGLGVLGQMQLSQFRQVMTPAGDRAGQRLLPTGGIYDRWNARREDLRTQLNTGVIGRDVYDRQTRESLRQLGQDARGAGGGLRQITGLLRGTAMTGVLATQFAARGVAGTAGLVGGPVRGMLGAAGRGLTGAVGGPIGLGLVGATAALSLVARERRRREEDSAADAGGTSFIDDYRVAMGKATEATTTFSQKMEAAANTAAGAVVAMKDAQTIDKTDVDRANALSGAEIRRFAGSDEQIASQINLQAQTYGLAPDELDRIGLDLIKQFTPERAQSILGKVRPAQGDLSSSSVDAVAQAVAATAEAPGAGGFQGFLNWVTSSNLTGGGQGGGVGGTTAWNASGLSEGQRASATDTVTAVGDRRAKRSELYGAEFANQQAYQEMDAAVTAAYEAGNEDLANRLIRGFEADLGAADRGISGYDIEKAGGFVAALAGIDAGFREQYERQMGAQGGTARTLTPQLQENWVAEQAPGNLLAGLFSNQGPGAQSEANRAVADWQRTPEDAGLQFEALNQVMATFSGQGLSTTDQIAEIDEFLNAIGMADPALRALAEAARQAAQTTMAFERPFQTYGEQLDAQLQVALKTAEMTPRTPEEFARQQQARGEVASLSAEGIARLDARIKAQMEFDIGQSRQADDYGRSREYAEEDYSRQRGYTEEDYGRSRGYAEEDFRRSQDYASEDFRREQRNTEADFRRSQAHAEDDYQRSRLYQIADFNKQVRRQVDSFERGQTRALDDFRRQRGYAEADFQRSQLRAQRDFQISQRQSEEDFLRQRGRMIRDWNKQVTRQIQDAARTLYNPYDRMMTQATWDARTLLSNLEEQAQAMRNQLSNLDTLRGAGVDDAAIRLLGLDKTENAQQLARLINDIANDPAVVGELNRAAEGREGLAGQLVTGSLDFARQREDFQTSLSDMEADFELARKRSIEAFERSRADAIEEFTISMERQAEEFALANARAREDLQISLAQMAEDQAEALRRAEEAYLISSGRALEQYLISAQRAEDAFARQTSRAEEAQARAMARQDEAQARQMARMDENQIRQMGRMAEQQTRMVQRQQEDLARMDQEFTGSMEQRLETARRIAAGQAVNYSSIMSNGFGSLITTLENAGPRINAAYKGIQATVQVSVTGTATPNNAAKQADKDTAAGKGVYDPRAGAPKYTGSTGSPLGSSGWGSSSTDGSFRITPSRGYASGGLVFDRQTAEVAEEGPELVLPLDHRGAQFLSTLIVSTAMRLPAGGAQRELARAPVTAAQANRTDTGGRSARITYATETHTYDSSTSITGPLTVVAQDPDEMARKLAARRSRDQMVSRRPRG